MWCRADGDARAILPSRSHGRATARRTRRAARLHATIHLPGALYKVKKQRELVVVVRPRKTASSSTIDRVISGETTISDRSSVRGWLLCDALK